jgi:ElaB/YqjD/DUF883 family membrane-anchored ribosome-binding protein
MASIEERRALAADRGIPMSSQYESSDLSANGSDMNTQSDSTDGKTSRIGSQISEFAQTAKSQAASAIEPIANNARSMAEEQKERGANRIDGIARAVHSAAEEISKEVPVAATYVHAAADRLERTSSLLRDNSVEDLARMATDFAQERPLLFIGGAVASGFLITRLLRSSAEAEDESEYGGA